jgi:predicted O-methyltransferase YrrM
MSSVETISSAEIMERAIEHGASQKRDEFEHLIDLVMKLEPKVILEIGSKTGGSLLAWRIAAPDANIISISLTGGTFGGGAVEPWVLVYDEPLQIVNSWFDLDSHDTDTLTAVLKLLGNEPIDFLFIDGDHTYEGSRQDFAMYSWLVRRGGLIAFHDILPHPADQGVFVRKLWKQLKTRFDTEEFLGDGLRDLELWGGIGVIKW